MTRRARQNPTRYQRETGEKLPRWRQKLAQYAAEGGYYVHFSNYPKTGVYPTNKYETPTGFYAYPLAFHRISEFATDRPYAIVFKPVRARLWVLKNYTPADYSRDLKILHTALGRFQVAEWKRDAEVRTPAGQMWNITRMLAKGSVARWTKIIYEVLGYDGVIDDCMAIIHTHEPCQAVFFDMRTGSTGSPQNEKVQIVDVLEKGKSTKLMPSKGIDFYDKDLRHKNLRKLDLRNADFTESNLSGADLSGLNLSGANLRAANISDANLTGTDLRGAFLTSAFLTGANLTGAFLHGANLSGAKFTSATLTGAFLTAADLHGADLTGAGLRSAILRSANLYGAVLEGADLSGADLSSADLSRADLEGAHLSGANLRGAILRSAHLYGVAWDADTIWPAGFKVPATSYRRPAS